MMVSDDAMSMIMMTVSDDDICAGDVACDFYVIQIMMIINTVEYYSSD